jgi:hemerythrin superfamily protein
MAQNIVDIIKQDHEMVLSRLNEVMGRMGTPPTGARTEAGAMTTRAGGTMGRVTGSPEQDLMTVAQMTREHMAAEEMVFYARLENEMGDQINEARREHDMVRNLIQQVESMQGSGQMDQARMMDTLSEIRRNVEHHVQEEENRIIPRAREMLGDQELGEMGRRFDEEKQRYAARGPGAGRAEVSGR